MPGTCWGFICSQGWTEVNKVYPLLIWATGSLQLHGVGQAYQTNEFTLSFIFSCTKAWHQKRTKISLSLLNTKSGWSPHVSWSRRLKQAGQKLILALFCRDSMILSNFKNFIVRGWIRARQRLQSQEETGSCQVDSRPSLLAQMGNMPRPGLQLTLNHGLVPKNSL